jgi:eukaryotic-like serine/threonine-protein kinase
MNQITTEVMWTIPRPGETVAGKYVVEGPCGRGGLAVVLSAVHAGLDRRVALKVLLPEWAGDPQIVERFLREGRAATRIKSEHVVRVFDVGSLENGAPYMVLEYLEGQNLETVVATWGPIAVSTAIDWVLQAAEAIAEAHSYGIVHRDLKPGNLFLTRRPDGTSCVKVIDFGLSKLTDPRMRDAQTNLTRPTDIMGSPPYMAPEQLRATCEADARADQWALGAVLHELVTGRPPFHGESMPMVCATVLMDPAPPLSTVRSDVPAAVEQAVLRCLEKTAEARFANLAEMAHALAPYGSPAARTSCARIERVLDSDASLSALSLFPPIEVPPPDTSAWPIDPKAMGPVFVAAVSGKVVTGCLIVLTGLGAAALMWIHSTVHGSDAPTTITAGAPYVAIPTPLPAPPIASEAPVPAPPQVPLPAAPQAADPHAARAPTPEPAPSQATAPSQAIVGAPVPSPAPTHPAAPAAHAHSRASGPPATRPIVRHVPPAPMPARAPAAIPPQTPVTAPTPTATPEVEETPASASTPSPYDPEPSTRSEAAPQPPSVEDPFEGRK